MSQGRVSWKEAAKNVDEQIVFALPAPKVAPWAQWQGRARIPCRGTWCGTWLTSQHLLFIIVAQSSPTPVQSRPAQLSYAFCLPFSLLWQPFLIDDRSSPQLSQGGGERKGDGIGSHAASSLCHIQLLDRLVLCPSLLLLSVNILLSHTWHKWVARWTGSGCGSGS